MAQNSKSYIPLNQSTQELLKKLPSRRMRDVLEKRFGLKSGKKFTLEAIGKEYRITRERVRQIEADALSHLAKHKESPEVYPAFQAIQAHLVSHGGVMAENHFLAGIAEAKNHPHAVMLLNSLTDFSYLPEGKGYNASWCTHKKIWDNAETILQGTVKKLEKIGHPISKEELYKIITQNVAEVSGALPSVEVCEVYLNISKLIAKNPYGEYGLTSWHTINPRGVKDKAYLVLLKSGKPLHFREVAQGINKTGWSQNKAHPQTVHNELIKDPRFVLVGRGLYALREWGYEPGIVRDVLISVLKQAGRPLAKDEIIRQMLSKRFVKEPTILLNLQNRSVFKKLEDGRFVVA